MFLLSIICNVIGALWLICFGHKIALTAKKELEGSDIFKLLVILLLGVLFLYVGNSFNCRAKNPANGIPAMPQTLDENRIYRVEDVVSTDNTNSHILVLTDGTFEPVCIKQLDSFPTSDFVRLSADKSSLISAGASRKELPEPDPNDPNEAM